MDKITYKIMKMLILISILIMNLILLIKVDYMNYEIDYLEKNQSKLESEFDDYKTQNSSILYEIEADVDCTKDNVRSIINSIMYH
jgi:uncharacterized protein YoxC